MADLETLCVIPARGGSRGIPRKNLQLLAGRPLVAHAIDEACRARLIDRVVVSTDDEEIAEIAHRYGAEVIRRPDELASDEASSEAAILHALESLSETQSYEPDLVVFVQCTSPLAISADIDGAVEALLAQDADSALAVAPAHYFLWKRGASGFAEPVNHDKRVRPRRQEREPQFVETGAVYVMRVEGFREARHRFFGTTAMYEMPRERHLEIDDPVDLERAEAALRRRERGQWVHLLPSRPSALVLDFDGVLTDNRVSIDQEGLESVQCHRGDGMGIDRLRRVGVPVLVLSTEANPVVSARCEKLGIPCLHGLDDKVSALETWLDERGLEADAVVYLGNDVNDSACMAHVGCGVAVADAHEDVKPLARIILSRPGGHGAVRELTDLIETRLNQRDDG